MMYRSSPPRDEDDDPTLPSVRCPDAPVPLVPWWRAVLGLVLLA